MMLRTHYPSLADAVVLAAYAYNGRMDKEGAPALLHSLRMMLTQVDDLHRMTAVLHDVVEDTDVTLEMLRNANYPQEVVEAVDALTRRGQLEEGERYFDYVRRCRENPIGRTVKIADIQDNLNRTAESGLRARYEKALELLR